MPSSQLQNNSDMFIGIIGPCMKFGALHEDHKWESLRLAKEIAYKTKRACLFISSGKTQYEQIFFIIFFYPFWVQEIYLI